MKSIAITICTAVLSLALIEPALAFRCGESGNNLAQEGMHKYEILKDCGSPYSKEIVGRDLREEDRGPIYEEWIYLLTHYHPNQMYLIRFDRDGYAREIRYLGDR